MILDGDSIAPSTGLECDICIVGAGAAGLAMANAFIHRPETVFVLEGGGLKPDHESQMLYGGEIVGLPMPKLFASRGRMLGGSTNVWNGYCRLLDPLDFEHRDWIGFSGWPIHWREMSRYGVEACRLLGIETPGSDIQDWEDRIVKSSLSFLPLSGHRFESKIEHACDTIYIKNNILNQIKSSDNVKIITNLSVNQIVADSSSGIAKTVDTYSRCGHRVSVRAKEFVLATGGIENARLLLLSKGASDRGLANENDLVGRFFMDHPRVRSARILLANQSRHRRLYEHSSAQRRRVMEGEHKIFTYIAPSRELQEVYNLSNARSYLIPAFCGSDTKASVAIRKLRSLQVQNKQFGIKWPELFRGENFRDYSWQGIGRAVFGLLDRRIDASSVDREFYIETTMEQQPNPDSRVTLCDKKDRFGFRLPSVDWQLFDHEKTAFEKYHDLLLSEMVNEHLVSISSKKIEVGKVWPHSILSSWHHMGTTRMSSDFKTGVVDTNCLVHGLQNVHIAGSSVFPTGGSNAPTLTLLALALRLADRLKSLIRPG